MTNWMLSTPRQASVSHFLRVWVAVVLLGGARVMSIDVTVFGETCCGHTSRSSFVYCHKKKQQAQRRYDSSVRMYFLMQSCV